MTDDRLANHQVGLAALHAEGQGVWRASIYSAAGIRQVYADARGSDAEAIEIARLFDLYFAGVWRITASGLLRCIACPCVFNLGHLPAGLSVLAAVEQPHDRFVAGICRSCANRPDLRDAIRAWCREMFGNACSIQTGAAGRAQAKNRAGLEAMNRAGQGVLRFGLYPSGMPIHLADPDLVAAITGFINDMANRPTQCLLCHAAFSSANAPAAIQTLCAAIPDARDYLTGGICGACWRLPDVWGRVRAALAEGFGVSVRVLDIGPAGHA